MREWKESELSCQKQSAKEDLKDMKKIVFVAALILLLVFTIKAQESSKRTPADIKAEQEVLKVDTERAEAYMHGDTAALSRILADDCTYVHPTGKVETKAEVIAGFKAGDRTYVSIERDDVVAKIYGNTAVLAGRNTIKAKYQGQDYTVQNRFLRVYVKQQGQWKLVAHQSTNLPK